ncbi:hypothetical protein GCM10010156_13790 [Planobispora rosea]|uniref:Uncharacterized protein n=1 Tax=Planobispora rosea TaxID=35762 RepID=A0A8J3RYH5_PLARO|nr:hypothetical protein GCM10010156_13790 [Planobispora rosea]GIH83549.1 hypothetical protein Pro02_19570 [Planobispora rosea]
MIERLRAVPAESLAGMIHEEAACPFGEDAHMDHMEITIGRNEQSDHVLNSRNPGEQQSERP